MKKTDVNSRASRAGADETKTAKFLELNAAGQTCRQIADATGADYQVVYNTLKAKGAEIVKAAPATGETLTAAVKRLWDADVEVGEIVRQLRAEPGREKLKYQAVYNTLVRLGEITTGRGHQEK